MSAARAHQPDAFMATFFDMSLDLLGIASLDGRLLTINKRWEQVLGYPLDELQGAEFLKYVHPDDVAPTLSEMSVLSEGKSVNGFVNRYRAKDGGYRNLEWQAHTDEDGNIHFVARDVTDRVRMEETLSRNHRLLKEVGRLSGVGHWEVDVVGQKIYWDPVTRQIHEVDDDYVPNLEDGINFYALEARAEVERCVNEGIKAGRPWDFTLPLITAKGRRIWVRAVGHAVYDKDEVVQLQGGFQDVTDERALRESLREKSDAALAASKAKSEFLTNMSHEIRTPLHGILGTAQLLEKSELSDAQKTYVGIIQNSGHALLNLVEDVLDLARIETGKLVIDSRPFAIASAVRVATDSVSYQARSKGLDFQVELDPDLPARAQGDPKRIGQIVTNFLSNAVKFTPSGRVVLRAIRGKDDTLRLEVSDTGPGLSQDEQARIFERFQQAQSTRDQHAQGAGLGLSISREIARAAGGEIGVESEVGHGSTFWVELPVTFLSGVEVSESRSGDDGDVVERHYRILVVDDIATNRLVASAALRNAGCTTREAADGQEAIAALEAEAFDAVLMDIQMPGLSGDEAIRRIRASDSEYSSMPIFAMTADATHGAAERYSRIGATGYLTKPLDFSDVLHALDGVLRPRVAV